MFRKMKKPYEAIPAVFRYVRLCRNLSQRKFALLLGVHQSTVCRVEKGIQFPWRRTVKRLEKLIGRPLSDIIPDAMEALRQEEAIRNRAAGEYTSVTRLSEKMLTESDRSYLHNRQKADRYELNRDIKSKKYRLQKKIAGHCQIQRLHDSYERQIREQTSLINYLRSTHASEKMLQRQQHRMKILTDLKKILPAQLTNMAELYLEQMKLEAMEYSGLRRAEKVTEEAA